MTNWTRRMRREHKCVQCGRANDRYPRWTCSTCYARWYTPERRQANSVYDKKRIAALRAAGLCVRCGFEETKKFAWCLSCRLANGKWRKLRRQRRMQEQTREVAA